MRKSCRNLGRIDYKIFHQTGEKIKKVGSERIIAAMSEGEDVTKFDTSERKCTPDTTMLIAHLQSLEDDIRDFEDENSLDDIGEESINDVDFMISRMEDLRTNYRTKYKELCAFQVNTEYEESYDENLKLMKNYILKAKEKRRRIRTEEESGLSDKKQLKNDAFKFLMKNIKRQISELENICSADVKMFDENELLRRSNELTEIDRKSEFLSEKFVELLSFKSNKEEETEVSHFEKRYDELISTKNNYVFQVKEEIESKELNKEEIFKEANLNIKLRKFSGYCSIIDIYTFQSEFEKLNLRSTPTRMLPDVLKNNYLEGAALSLVKSVDEINEIWKRLKNAFGNPKIMLRRKFEEVSKIRMSWKSKDSEVIDSLQKVVNLLKDLMTLAEQHAIENDLYHGDGLERIFQILGQARAKKWIADSCEKELTKKESWNYLITFLETESKILQRKMVLFGTDLPIEREEKSNRSHYADAANAANPDKGREKDLTCSICNQSGHVATRGPNFTKVVQYFACRKFVEMTPAERFSVVKKKGYCYQCLLPGADVSKGKHKEGKCQRDFTCKHPNHDKYHRKKHVLLCEEHKASEDNKRLLQEYKARCILKEKTTELPSFSKDIKLSFHSHDTSEDLAVVKLKIDGTSAAYAATEANEKAIYQLQSIKVDGKRYSLFYDSGCGDFISSHAAVTTLGTRAIQECKGPIPLGGVGGIITESPHGIYSIKLPQYNGDDAHFSGICLDRITGKFPNYPLKGKVEEDIKNGYEEIGGNPDDLPKLPRFVGGEVDFLVGIKYLRYHPEIVFQMPTGLTIYKSKFRNADGGCGVIGGPHEVFTAIEKQFYMNSNHLVTFLGNQEMIYRSGYQINPDISLLGFKYSIKSTAISDVDLKEINEVHVSHRIRRFEEVEKTGSEITYRCIKCRACKSCTNCEQIESVSIKEEVEDHLIAKSVTVDINKRISMANLPLIHDPVLRLAPNKHNAMRTYLQQLKKLDKNPSDKEDVIKSEKKLQDLGFVDYVKNLPEEQRQMLSSSKIQNYIPWRAVWKEDSISTPCRIVFDASQATDSGYSLNDILAKGRNNMNKLQEIIIRWSSHQIGFHSDVQKMYNCVKLNEKHWCLQRYIWHDELDTTKIPEEKVIKTVIYGVKSSGNLAERSIRETAKLSKEAYPEVNEIVNKDIYVDDCLTGEKSMKLALSRADELELVLNKGGFSLKGVAFSGLRPPETMSEDGVSIVVAGMRWYTEDDQLSLNMGDMIFKKKQRGKRPKEVSVNVIPDKLTRRHCVAKVAEVYDLLGKFTPITAGMKLDLHELVARKLQWDDTIPDNVRAVWESHFEMIKEMKNVRYNRAIVPADAVNLNINTINFGDASQMLLCVAIYARFLRRNGDYSCQLVLSRSRIIPDSMSQPRAELYAALVNVHSGEIVKRAFYKTHQSSVHLTDSQIVLHWINNEDKPLKQWVRNRVLEIRRFTQLKDWRYIDSKNMLADIGTRKGSTLDEVKQDSLWINGYDWMKKDVQSFPVKTASEISLIKEEITEVLKEEPHVTYQKDTALFTSNPAISRRVPPEVMDRYRYSQYVIDPNKRNFSMVIRILAIVMKFIKLLREGVNKANVTLNSIGKRKIILSEQELKEAENYFFRKGTLEMKKFYKEETYSKFSREQNGVLIYTGRILPIDTTEVVGTMTEVMKDLTATSFCVPVLDKLSPIAYSIVMDFHWNHDVIKHSGVETTQRKILEYVYIHGGRDLVKKVRQTCDRCRYLLKRTIDVSMGPISPYNITLAPAFYRTQTDLAGPFKSYSFINKRATLKIWVTIFCCAATSSISLKIMEDYGSQSFIQAFMRFSCEVGYPKCLLVDGGSQLISSCDNMKLNFQDLQFKLHRDVSVQCEVVPVGGHNMNGKVERKIREVRGSMEKNIHNERLSVLQWETLVSNIANRINDLPLALGNVTSDFEAMDLLTPNRLKLGRNNSRSPISNLTITNNPGKIIKENQRIFDAWFENWLLVHVPRLMFQPKWFTLNRHLKVGDVVLFQKHDSQLSATYQYGMVQTVEIGRDGIIRKAKVKYRNHYENFDRETFRAVRELVMIHPIDELDLTQELAEMQSNCT